MQIGEFAFQLDKRVIGAGNVARAAGAGAHLPRLLSQSRR